MHSAELFSNYFVNIRENLAKKITTPNINHSHNSQDYCSHSFFLSPTNSEEVEAIIKTSKIRKATLSGDIDVKFINTRTAATVILTVLEFQGGIFFLRKIALVQNFMSFPN